MKKFTQVLSLCLAGGALLFSQPAMAEDCCQWNGCWRLGAELLYWKPCVCDWEYAQTLSPSASTASFPEQEFCRKVVTMTPSFGFRLFGVYDSEDGCNFTSLSWTYLKAQDSAKAEQPSDLANLRVPPFTDVGAVEVSQKNEYSRVWLRFGHYLYQGSCVNFYTYAGVEFIDLDQKRNIDAINVSTILELSRFREKSEYYAFGFDLGVGGEYSLGCGINIAGQVGAIASVGRRKHRWAVPSATSSGGTRRFYPSRIHCVPGVDARLGLNWARECGCTEFTFEIGYALDYYFRVLTVSRGLNRTFSECVDVGFSGPYASFELRF